MDFKTGLHNKGKIIEDYLNLFFTNAANTFEEKIYESMKYSLLAGGKRIRPILVLEIGKLFGAKFEDLIDYACAIEMIHTYSLIHDDLPAMDNDDLRRGKPTNHIVYGDAIAVLAGDALLNSAFELMTKKALESNNMNYIKAMSIIGSASGVKGMIGGQVADILSENQTPNKETLEYIHLNKTSAILTASILAGAHIANVGEKNIERLTELGHNIGLSFQIKDDILDIESTTDQLGKPIGSDEKNAKLTYPSLYGIEASKEKINELSKRSYEILDIFDGDSSFIKSLVDFLNVRMY